MSYQDKLLSVINSKCSSDQDRVEQLCSTYFVPTAAPTPPVDNYHPYIKGELSPDGRYLAYWWEDKYISDGEKEPTEKRRLYIQEQTSVTRLLKSDFGWEDPNPETYPNKKLIVWDNSSKRLAAVLRDRIMVIDLIKEVPNQKPFFKIEYEGYYRGGITGKPGLWFKNNKLFLSVKDGVMEFWPVRQMVSRFDNPMGAYPIKGGYLFWRQETKVGEWHLMRYVSNTDQIINTNVKEEVDFISNVLANSSGTKICYEINASGFHGYVLYDLVNHENVLDGQQYSWCGRWLDDNKISLVEQSYQSQWFKQIFLYDWVSKQRKPITQVSLDNYTIDK